MDEQNTSRSKGRAYIVFESTADAGSFVEKMNEKSFEGRILRIGTSADKPRGRDSLGGSKKGGLARYWEKDITTKCFRCGGVGHMSGQCPNEEQSKPCPLCAKTGHDSYSCALSRICFNCGVPGHINRECPERRGLPRRIVCGACFISGHHRWECRERIRNIPSYGATCLVCGKAGHFMCDEMKWFFGLKGISCFNCGRSGHHGSNCDRPKIDECARNPDLFLKEIERAEAVSLSDELEEQRQKRMDDERNRNRNRGRDRDRSTDRRDRDDNQSRAKSQPPSRFQAPQNQASNYGRIQSSNSNRHDQSRSPPPRDRDDNRGYGGRGDDRSSGKRNSSGGGRSNSSGAEKRNSSGGGKRNSSGGEKRNSSGRGYR